MPTAYAPLRSPFDDVATRVAIVERCLANPAAQHDEETKRMRIWAETVVITPDMHRCYWNCRLFEAVVCDFSLPLKRRAVHHLISNGVSGYFEQVTHSGYHTTQAFERLGLSLAGAISTKPGCGRMYFYLSNQVLRQLRNMFDLHTVTPQLDLDFYRMPE